MLTYISVVSAEAVDMTDAQTNTRAAKGRFITLEGGEGVGKSTNLAEVCRCLDEAGIDYIQSREPGGTPLAEAVRELTLEARDESMPGMAEVLLMFAARSIHIENKLRPALESGKWVVCDRFVDASYAYQGCGRELGTDAIETLEQLVVADLQPDLTLLLDASPEVGEQRIGNREHDRIEQEQRAFFHRVREGYLARAKQSPQRVQRVDASQSLVDVQRQVRDMTQRFIKANR